MNVLLFGATGMVGQAVLRECLLDPDVKKVQVVGRNPTGKKNSKLSELIHEDMHDFSSIESELKGFDVCVFCIGVSSSGLTPAEYKHVTFGIPFSLGLTLSRISPETTFIFISAAGADSTAKSRTMWARIKGKTENMLFSLPFKQVYVFRPALIRPMDGIKSRTRYYRIFYRLLAPILPLMHRFFPNQVTSTRELAHAIMDVAKKGEARQVIDRWDFRLFRSRE